MITNPNPGTFMRNLEIQDELQAEGIKIIPGTVAVISGGKTLHLSVRSHLIQVEEVMRS